MTSCLWRKGPNSSQVFVAIRAVNNNAKDSFLLDKRGCKNAAIKEYFSDGVQHLHHYIRDEFKRLINQSEDINELVKQTCI